MIALAAALLMTPAPPQRTWTKDGGGDWNTAANWSGGMVPQPGEIAYLGGTNAGRTITLSGTAATVAGVYGGDHLIVDGTTLKITGDPVETTSFEDGQVRNGGSIDLAGPGTVQGAITLDGGALKITGTGVELSGRYGGSGPTTITGTVEYSSDAGLVFRTSSFENDGVIKADKLLEVNPSAASPASDGRFELGPDGRLLVRNSLTLGAASSVTGGAFELVGGTFSTQGTFAPAVVRTVSPAILALAGTTTAGTATGDGDVTNSGTFVVSGNFGTGGTYTQTAGLTNVLAGATLDKDVVLNGGTLKGKGTVRSLTNHGGIVEPGASPGTLTVTKDFTQTAGTLRIEDGDLLAVGGRATLGGTLELVGEPANPLRFLTAQAVSGAWATEPANCSLDACSPAPPPPPVVVVTPGATPTPTPTPAVTPKPKHANVVFPARCRHHKLTVRVSGDVRRATIKVNGKRAKTLSKPGTATLRGRRRTKVAVAVTLTDGRTLIKQKTYRTC